MQNHIEFLEYIASLAEEIVNTTTDREEVYDLVWDHADSSEHVIYYGKAHDLLHLIRNWDASLYNDAEAEVEDLTCGGDPAYDLMSFDKHATVLAFCIIRLELSRKVEELIEEKEASEELAAELANA